MRSTAFRHLRIYFAGFLAIVMQSFVAHALNAQDRVPPPPTPVGVSPSETMQDDWSAHTPRTTPISRLDSVLEFSRRYRAFRSKNLAMQLEEYLAEFPHSPALMLAIGISFYRNSPYYSPHAKHPSSCADTLNYAFADSALHWIALARRTDPTIRDYEFQLPVAEWLGQAYAASILDCIITHRAAQVRKLLIDAKLDSVIAPLQFRVADEFLAELPHDAILILDRFSDVDNNALIALLYRQVVERTRTDVSTVLGWMMPDSGYAFVARHGLEGIYRRIETGERHRRIIAATDSTIETTMDTITLSPALRTRIERLTGTSVSHTQVLNTNYTGILVPILRWNRPVFVSKHSGNTVGVKLSHGLLYELLPVEAGTATTLMRRYPIDSAIASALRSPRIAPLLRSASHDEFPDITADLARDLRVEDLTDTSLMLDVFNSIWNLRGGEDTSVQRPLLEIAEKLLPHHLSAERSLWADSTLKAKIRAQLFSPNPYIANISELASNIESKLGHCEYLHRLYDYARSRADADTLEDNFTAIVSELAESAGSAGCDWAPINVTAFLSDPHSASDDATTREYQVGDTAHLVIDFHNLPPASSRKVTLQWFSTRTSTVQRIDSNVSLASLRQTDRAKDNNDNDPFRYASTPITDAWPSGAYTVSVIYDGKVVSTSKFEVGEP